MLTAYKVASVVVAIMLLVALADLPYDYYMLLRVVVSGVAAYGVYVAHKTRREGWVWLLGGVVVLFNPIFPVGLTRLVWAPIDVATAFLFVASVFLLRVPSDR